MSANDTKYNYEDIEDKRAAGWTWEDVATQYPGSTSKQLRQAWHVWKKRSAMSGEEENPRQEPDENTVTAIFTKEEISRLTCLEDLLSFFEVDTARWQVANYKVNSWEQHSVEKGVVTLYQVKANLIPSLESQEDEIRDLWCQLVADVAAHAPKYERPQGRRILSPEGDPVLFELALFDPHFGMLAWRHEVGHDYDLGIAVQDYRKAVEYLLGFAVLYPTERILYVVGNDFLHVDSASSDARGNRRGGATTAGTAQDIDTRLAKMFTKGRKALVEGIDLARTVAPVDVLVVPGNHDREQMYRMGEVLSAWYRNDSEVNVRYSPNKRCYYGWGRNTFMFTHGEEYKRQRDSLPLVFATECPADLWVASEGGGREIHTGHNHVGMAGRYVPTADLNESRAIRTRSLAGMTPEDAWHHEEGYKHRRTASTLCFRKSGGLVGIHEFNL